MMTHRVLRSTVLIKTAFTAIFHKYRKQMESEEEDLDQLDAESLLKQQGKMDL